MFWTFVIFGLLSLYLGWKHMNASKASSQAMLCPKCNTDISGALDRCPNCRVPLQAFDVVKLAIAQEEEETSEAEQLHAMVRADICVGCATCIPACPEKGAIKLVNKLAVIDTDLCKGHGSCVEACPVGGILLGTGEAVHRVEVPNVGTDFQTNRNGIYIAGELGGRGLIKNAINEGRLAVESIALKLKEHDSKNYADVLDLLIVGSGPAGLSAAMAASELNLKFVIVDQGTLADSIRKYPRKKLLLAEPVKVPLYGDLWVADSSKENLLKVWEAIVENTGLQIETQTQVENITRNDGVFEIRTKKHNYQARYVLLAMGRRGTPRKLGVPGEELNKVLYDIVEMASYKGNKVVVVGGGDSAVESALGLSNQENTDVILSYRSSEFKRVKNRNRKKLETAVTAGKITLMLESNLTNIDQNSVDIRWKDQTKNYLNDAVIIRVGGEPPTPFLKSLGIDIVKKDVPLEESQL